MTRREHWNLEPLLQSHHAGRTELLEQRSVRGTAAQEDVLAVVDGQLAPRERIGGATEPPASLEQRHLRARTGAVECRGYARQTTAHHDHASSLHRQRSPPAATSPRAATHVFSSGESEIRPRITRPG